MPDRSDPATRGLPSVWEEHTAQEFVHKDVDATMRTMAASPHVTAAPDLIPPPLINQLKAGGRMVIPVGLPEAQQLVMAQKDLSGRIAVKEIMPVQFSLFEETDEPAFRAS